ncbi:MAG: orotidine 5'-phosphate decarboxylase [Elusimicrobia bacterium RIFOXYB2_FULL_48_7]|nr:MAG: orotidine 5'-phosphate decarboxylase [Elusimicrobia bacterium RIFOXYB2_FULL_48_7]
MAELVVALDVDKQKALELVKTLPAGVFFKIGHKLFTESPEIMAEINSLGRKVFLDLKYHDIPSVVGLAIQAVSKKYKPFAITLHTSGGPKMMQEASESRDSLPVSERPLLFGVTVLTSIAPADLAELFGDNMSSSGVEPVVLRLAQAAKKHGLNGVVCSGNELPVVKKACGMSFLTLVPGVQLDTANFRKDQQRTASIEEAAKLGDYLVVGRQITGSPSPAEETEKILKILGK